MARPRLQGVRTFQPVALDTGAAEVAQGLAQTLGAFRDVSAQAFQAGVAIDREQGAIEGLKAARAGDAELKEGLSGLTPFGQAFNQSVKAAHAAEAKQQFAIELQRIAENNGDDIAGFFNDAKAYQEGVIKEMPDDIGVDFAFTSDATLQKFGNELIDQVNERQTLESLAKNESYLETVFANGANFARLGDKESVTQLRGEYDKHLSSELYEPEEKRKRLEKFDAEVREQTIIGMALQTYEDEGADKAFNAIQVFEETPIQDVAPDEVKGIAERARGILNSKLQADERQSKQEMDAYKLTSNLLTEELLIEAVGAGEEITGPGLIMDKAQTLFQDRKITFDQFKKIQDEVNAPDGYDSVFIVEEINSAIYANASKPVVSEMISEARIAGTLTAEGANDLRKLNVTRSGLPQTPFELQRKQAYDFLKLSLTGSTDITGLDTEKGQRVANALQEYNERILNAEEAGENPIDIAKDIVPRYLAEDVQIDSLPRTRFGDRDKDTIQQLKVKLFDASENGLISQDTYEREARLIEQLERIQSREAAVKAAGG